jgi:hypothetical protein
VTSSLTSSLRPSRSRTDAGRRHCHGRHLRRLEGGSRYGVGGRCVEGAMTGLDVRE